MILSSNSTDLPGCIVVGGAAVNRRNKRWYIQSRFLNYLLELEELVGSIAFFATHYVDENEGLFPAPLPDSIELYPIGANQTTHSRIVHSAEQLLWYRQAQRTRNFVIHFFPAALTPAAQLVLRRGATTYLSYYKSDWIEWTRSQGRSTWKVRYWRALEKLELRISDISLFRSSLHRRKLQGSCKFSAISQPILSVSNPRKQTPIKDSDSFSLLFVGMIAPEKGLLELVQALGMLSASGTTNFHLHLVGAPHKNALSAENEPVAPNWLICEIAEAGLEKQISIHGFVNDAALLDTLFAQADIFVLPSWSEGFPRVLDEAMSYSLPIITTLVGGIGEVLENNIDAILLSPRDKVGLSSAIEKLQSDPRLRTQLGDAGHRNYLQRVTQSAAAQHAQLLYSAEVN